MSTAATRSLTRLQCMELRGGNGLVEEAFRMPGLDVWVYSRPFENAAAGGDVHFVSTCATGRIARVLVADVSGHGGDVGPVADTLRGLMARFVNFVDQRKFFAAVNRRFADLAEGGRFATAVVTTYFAPTRTLSVSNAGHPPPLIWDVAAKVWRVLDRARSDDESGDRNLPLGVIDAARYDRFDLRLDGGDLVLVYTDSLTESRDVDGELLSTAGLLRVAAGIDGSDPAAVVPAFVSALRDLHPGNLDGDDVTLLAFRPNGGGQCVTLRDRLLAPLRVLRGLLTGGRSFPEVSLANLGGAMFDGFSHRWPPKESRSP